MFSSKKLLLYLYYQQILQEENMSFRDKLTLFERRRRDRRIPREALVPYNQSSFHYLYSSGNNQALLNMTGLDHEKFSKLLMKFHHKWDNYTFDEKTMVIRQKQKSLNCVLGKPRQLDAIGGLGLVLTWYRTRGAVSRLLALVFGQTSTPLYKWLKFGRCILLSILTQDPESKISKPTVENVIEYSEAIHARYDLLQNVWGALDGLKTNIEETTNGGTQNNFYNGWTHGHYVNCLFLFAVHGLICGSVFNAPGVYHDSAIADYGMYELIDEVYVETGGKVVVDSAFKLLNLPSLIKSSQLDPQDPEGLLINRQATSVRQLSEWGMRMIQCAFPRLKDSLQYKEEGDRKIILRLMVHIYNFQTYNVGHNIILNSYMHKQSIYKSYYYQYADGISPDANHLLV